jgi:hypothetical protein
MGKAQGCLMYWMFNVFQLVSLFSFFFKNHPFLSSIKPQRGNEFWKEIGGIGEGLLVSEGAGRSKNFKEVKSCKKPP